MDLKEAEADLIATIKQRVASYSPEQKHARLMDLQRLTIRTMSAEQRCEYLLLVAPTEIVPITPPGQKIVEPFLQRDAKDRKPYVGGWVWYYTRPGENRMGRQKFPALVLEVHTPHPGAPDHKTCQLSVQYTATEALDVRAPRRSRDTPTGGWDFIPDDVEFLVTDLRDEVAVLRQELADLRGQVRQLTAKPSAPLRPTR